MNDLLTALPWFAVVIAMVICNSLNNDKIAIQTANERLMNDKIKIEALNDNLKDSIIVCQSELKGYANGSK